VFLITSDDKSAVLARLSRCILTGAGNHPSVKKEELFDPELHVMFGKNFIRMR